MNNLRRGEAVLSQKKDKYTVKEESVEEITEKKSRFIAYCQHVQTKSEAEAYIKKIKAKHKDARHNVYAYVTENPYTARYSDDGEPSGTAGPQILSLIKSMNLYNIVIVVTRYFGGILLGTGGLARAYKQSAKKSITGNSVVILKKYSEYKLNCDYRSYEKLKVLLQGLGGLIENISFSDRITADVKLPDDKTLQNSCEYEYIRSFLIHSE